MIILTSSWVFILSSIKAGISIVYFFFDRTFATVTYPVKIYFGIKGIIYSYLA